MGGLGYGKSLDLGRISGTVKFGGGSLMVWGCMTPQGLGYMCKIDGRMDAELYTSILQDKFLETVEFYGLDRANLIFQQDNDPNTPLTRPQNGSNRTTSMS